MHIILIILIIYNNYCSVSSTKIRNILSLSVTNAMFILRAQNYLFINNNSLTEEINNNIVGLVLIKKKRKRKRTPPNIIDYFHPNRV